MALKDMWCFDHLITANPNFATYPSTLPGLLGIPGAVMAIAGPGYGTIGIDTSGWIISSTTGVNSAASDYMPALGVPIANLFDTTKGRSWLGFRTKSDASSQLSYAQAPIFSVSSLATGAIANSAIVFSEADAVGLASMVLNKEYFIEVCFDRTNSQFLVYVDGILRKTFATDPKTYNAGWMFFGPGQNVVVSGTVTSLVANRHFRDFYFLDDSSDGSIYSTRLGPGRLTLATLAAVVANNAIVNNGGTTSITTALQVFQTAIATPAAALPPQTPNITTSSSYDPVTASFNQPAGSNTILAVQAFDAISNQVSGNGTLTPSLVQGSNTIALAKQTFSDQTMNFTRKMAVQTTAPDGGAWTQAKIAATSLVLTPGP